MTFDAESFDIPLDTVRRLVRERLVPAENQVEEEDEVPAKTGVKAPKGVTMTLEGLNGAGAPRAHC